MRDATARIVIPRVITISKFIIRTTYRGSPCTSLTPSLLRLSPRRSVIAAGGLTVCLWKLKHHLAERTPVLMGVMSAFVFAAQMVNFPLYPLPISGHLLGGVLSAVLLGPWAGAVVIAAVLIVQCLLFGDGGVTALGANFVNMGLIGSIGGYAIYVPLRRAMRGRVGILVGAMAAAWFSIPGFGSLRRRAAASGRRAGFLNVLALIALVHAAIGIGEADHRTRAPIPAPGPA